MFVNTFDKGGAAKACLRLYEGLRSEHLNVSILLKNQTSHIKNASVAAKKTPRQPNFREKLHGKSLRLGRELKIIAPTKKPMDPDIVFLNQRPSGLEYFSFPNSNYDLTDSPLYQEADIIHLHWVADFLDWETFFSKNTKPVVWTLHDQNPFLGGQHYNERYLGIDEEGMPIPRKVNTIETQKENELLEIKKSSIDPISNLWIVTPSEWLMKESMRSSIMKKFEHRLIPNGVPLNIFKSLDKKFCRQVLGLPTDKTIILFVADTILNSRKGYAFLRRAIQKVKDFDEDHVVCCAVGNKNELNRNQALFELGKIQDERLMAMAYSAADLFVIPSLEDNLPNTMLESLCCGTPVLGFPTGGIIDVVEDGVNGFLCDEISVQALVKGLTKFLSGVVVFDRDAISKSASERFSLAKQATAYIELYKDIMTQNGIK